MKDQGCTPLTATLELLVEEYRGWLVAERSLAPATVKYYVSAARLFLSDCDGWELKSLTLGEVNRFVVRQCPRVSVGHAKNLVTGLRSLLGYLYLHGLTDHQLAPAVPTPSGWHGSNLPKGLGADALAALLGGGDDATAVGRRDHAIIVLLARLGLRAGEVVALTLDDIGWSRGEIVVRGKGSRTEALPMPVDVGEALVGYLGNGRPQAPCRSLFLRAQAPMVALSASGVGSVVRRACIRVGVPPVGAHRLRHSAATAMLRAGASLEEVGQVLRQRSTQVTALYAKVDFVALRALALLTSLEGATLEAPLVVGNEVDLGKCALRGATGLETLRVVAADPNWPVYKGRAVVADEIRLRNARGDGKALVVARKRGITFEGETAPTERAVEAIYRQLRASLETSKAAPAAADFYYGEMEMRRMAVPRMSFEHALLTTYKGVSGYSLRAWRALATYSALILGLAALFRYRTSWLVSDRVAASGSPGLQFNRFWDVVAILARSSVSVLSAVTTGLTAGGTAIFIVIRLAGPALLALAVLALRSRLRR